MESFGKYSDAPSELRDLTRESTTFWLSQALLKKKRLLDTLPQWTGRHATLWSHSPLDISPQ